MQRKWIQIASFVGMLMVIVSLSWHSEILRHESLRLMEATASELAHGHLTGVFPGRRFRADFSILEPGDILLCHNPHGGYGYWTHAVLYVGGGQAVDAYDFERGTELRRVEAYQKYAEVAVLRAKIPRERREQVAHWALAEVGKPYDPLSGLTDTRSQYCSKLIWQLYGKAGVELSPAQTWILPDQLARSAALAWVAKWSVSPSVGRDVW
jgi:uncharacterized protein YycO